MPIADGGSVQQIVPECSLHEEGAFSQIISRTVKLVFDMAEKLTLEDRLNRVATHLVGLWRFRKAGEPVRWCCTYIYDGCYYDTWPKKTPNEALDTVHRTLQQMRSADKSRPRKRKPAHQ